MKVEGYMFITSGCEHGATLLVCDEWNQGEYDRLEEDSWCESAFSNPPYRAVLEDYPFVPGKRYRLTVEEII